MDLIEDSVHDLFVYVWNHKEKLSDTDSIRKYLLASLRNQIINELKKKSKVAYGEEDKIKDHGEDSIEDKIIDVESRAENKFQLESSFDVLSSRQKEAIFLRYYNEMSYEDICTVMKINYQSVRNLISTGLKKLSVDIKAKKE